MNPEISRIFSAAEQWNVNIRDYKMEKLDYFMKLLLDWNKKMNLTSITDPKQIVVEHFLDSISPLKLGLIENEQKIIDVGTGAGFPGIPLKIMIPELRLVLLDSLKKRTQFLEKVVEELNLDNVEIIHGRAEILGREKEFRENFDIVVSRAVAPLRVLSEYCIPFVKKDGYFISYKGPAVDKEIKDGEKAFKELKVDKIKIEEINIPYSEKQHKLIIIQKTSKTPNKYPRTSAKIKKSPL